MSQAFFCPTVMGMSRDWADSSCSTRGVEESAGRSCLCCDPHHHPASWVFVPFFGFSQLQDLGRSSGPMPYPKAASGRYIPPTVGILGEVRGRALEALFSQVQALESPGQW